MESSVKEACFDEINHLVLDCGNRVSSKLISNNWDVPVNIAASVLNEWMVKQKNLDGFIKEYLVRGTDKNKNGLITIVPEIKLNALKRNLDNVSIMLQSIETRSKSSRKIGISDYNECKIINLKIQSEERAQRVFHPRETEVRKQPVDKQIGTQLKATVENRSGVITEKKEISAKIVKNMFAKALPKNDVAIANNKENGTVKKESPVTSKNESPKSKESPKKKNVKKESIKNTIATFFNNNNKSNAKPTSSTTQNQSPRIHAKEEIKTPNKPQEPVKVEKATPNSATKNKKVLASDSIKRTLADLCDDDGSSSGDDSKIIPSTPQEKVKKPTTKRPRKNNSKKSNQNGNAHKRSRIVEIEDSSDDESLNDISIKSPTKVMTENCSSAASETYVSPSKNRHIAKRMVTRTYEDKDGFIREFLHYFKYILISLIIFQIVLQELSKKLKNIFARMMS